MCVWGGVSSHCTAKEHAWEMCEEGQAHGIGRSNNFSKWNIFTKKVTWKDVFYQAFFSSQEELGGWAPML